MTELDPLEQTLERARAALAPSLADDARLRRALGLAPGGSLPEALPPAGETVARQGASPFPLAARALAPTAGVSELRAWRALRASGSAGLLAGVMLAGFAFGAGLWLGRAGVVAEPPPAGLAAATEPDALERGSIAAAPPEPRATAPLQQDGVELSSERDRAIPGDEQDALSAPTPLPPEVASPRAELPARRAKPSSRRDGRAPSRAHSTAPSAANEELALLRRVERALRAQNPALALALLAELDQRFPDTRLGEERAAAHVIASCGVGEGGARFRAERFVREHSGSVYAERVHEACAIPEKPTRSEGRTPLGDE